MLAEMGKACKSLVKVTKKALKSVTNIQPIREDQIIITLVQIEETITVDLYYLSMTVPMI